MNQDQMVIVAGDDVEAEKLRRALARQNIVILASGLAAGLSVERASAMCMPLNQVVTRPRVLTDVDQERMEAAERKRQLRAAKRCAEAV